MGLIDILFVVAAAGQLTLADPESMTELLKLPLSLLPTFLVPIIIFSHLVIGYRLIFSKNHLLSYVFIVFNQIFRRNSKIVENSHPAYI